MIFFRRLETGMKRDGFSIVQRLPPREGGHPPQLGRGRPPGIVMIFFFITLRGAMMGGEKGSKILAVSHSVECGPRAWVYDRQKSIGKQWMEWNESRRGSSSLSSFAPSLLFLLLFFTPFCHHNRPILIAEQGVLLTPWFE